MLLMRHSKRFSLRRQPYESIHSFMGHKGKVRLCGRLFKRRRSFMALHASIDESVPAAYPVPGRLNLLVVVAQLVAFAFIAFGAAKATTWW